MDEADNTQGDKRKTVLYVDDDEINRDMLSRRLTRRGFEVVMAEDGQEALNFCAGHKADIILLDLSMPEVDGWEFMRRFRETDTSTPVILVTAWAMGPECADGLLAGADDYEYKPIDFSRLISKVNDFLNRNPVELERDRAKNVASILVRRNEQLRERLALLSEKNEDLHIKEAGELQAMCGAVAHGLKGEFMHIGSASRAIRELCASSPDVQEECDLIDRSVEYSQLLLHRLLNFLDVGKPQIEPVEVSELIRRTERLARPRLPSNISLEINVPSGLMKERAAMNVEQLIGVLIELINNATKALRATGGTIRLSVGQKRDHLIAVSVADDGPGIPAEIRPFLFAKQLPSKGGLGLGLHLSSRVIAAMGGELRLEKTSEQGSTFSILLLTVNEEES